MDQHHNRIFVHMEKTAFVIKDQLVEPHRHQHYIIISNIYELID